MLIYTVSVVNELHVSCYIHVYIALYFAVPKGRENGSEKEKRWVKVLITTATTEATITKLNRHETQTRTLEWTN